MKASFSCGSHLKANSLKRFSLVDTFSCFQLFRSLLINQSVIKKSDSSRQVLFYEKNTDFLVKLSHGYIENIFITFHVSPQNTIQSSRRLQTGCIQEYVTRISKENTATFYLLCSQIVCIIVYGCPDRVF